MKLILFVFLIALATPLSAEEDKTKLAFADSYTHEGDIYPPVFFITNIDDNDFKAQLVNANVFEALDEEAIGLPISLRIVTGTSTKQDATVVSSALLAASTLGLIPVVSNNEFIVNYQLFSQGKLIAKFEYILSSTDVSNLWSAGTNKQETPSEVDFVKRTLPQFFTELKASEEAQDLFKEYRRYFGF